MTAARGRLWDLVAGLLVLLELELGTRAGTRLVRRGLTASWGEGITRWSGWLLPGSYLECHERDGEDGLDGRRRIFAKAGTPPTGFTGQTRGRALGRGQGRGQTQIQGRCPGFVPRTGPVKEGGAGKNPLHSRSLPRRVQPNPHMTREHSPGPDEGQSSLRDPALPLHKPTVRTSAPIRGRALRGEAAL